MRLGQRQPGEAIKLVGERLDELSGQMAAVMALLTVMPNPTDEQIKQANALLVAKSDLSSVSIDGESGRVVRQGAKFLQDLARLRPTATGE